MDAALLCWASTRNYSHCTVFSYARHVLGPKYFSFVLSCYFYMFLSSCLLLLRLYCIRKNVIQLTPKWNLLSQLLHEYFRMLYWFSANAIKILVVTSEHTEFATVQVFHALNWFYQAVGCKSFLIQLMYLTSLFSHCISPAILSHLSQ